MNSYVNDKRKACRAGEIVDWLERFRAQPGTLVMPEIPHNSFEKKLHSTYLSYLPREKGDYTLKVTTTGGDMEESVSAENNLKEELNIGIDTANGATYEVADKVFKTLGIIDKKSPNIIELSRFF